MAKGCVYLVGAGTGDPGLITLRGLEVLRQADVVVYDHLATPRLLGCVRGKADRIYVGKEAGAHTFSQDEINELLIARACEGATVVRLKGGDPFVFGRGGEEALALVEAGVQFEVVPGVTAGVAALAWAGIPATHRGLASSLGLVTGHEAPGKSGGDLDFQALAGWGGTLVFYMGVRNLGQICGELASHGLSGETPAAVIQWGTTPAQQVVTGTVADLADKARAAGIGPPAVLVIGRVVALREKLNWFERRPLFGRRIVVTRAQTQASELSARLEALGAEAIEMPTIRIEPPEDPAALAEAARQAGTFDWIVFTSVNGVSAFFGSLAEAGLDARAFGGARVCAIGPATAQRLADSGIRADAQPDKFVSSEIARTLVDVNDMAGKRILLPRAEIASQYLMDDLEGIGAKVTQVAAYRTVPDAPGKEHIRELLENDQLHWITFTSSSTVRNFFSAIGPQHVRSASVQLASIGPVTSGTMRGLGVEPSVQADRHTIDGLVAAVLAREAAIAESTEGTKSTKKRDQSRKKGQKK